MVGRENLFPFRLAKMPVIFDQTGPLVDQLFARVVCRTRNRTLAGATRNDADLKTVECRTLPSSRSRPGRIKTGAILLTQDIGRSPMYNCALRLFRIRNDHHKGDAVRALHLTQNHPNYQAGRVVGGDRVIKALFAANSSPRFFGPGLTSASSLMFGIFVLGVEVQPS